MPIDLYYHLYNAPSRASLITAQYLGVQFNIKEVDFLSGDARKPEFLKINPAHTLPALVDNGLVLFESRAIMAYLVNKYAPNNPIYPQNAEARAQVDKVFYFDASSYFPALRTAFTPKFQKQEPTKQVLDELNGKIQILERLLGDQNFFAGENVTLADISLGASVPLVKQMFSSMWTDKLESWYQRLEKAVPQVGEVNGKIDVKPFL